MMTRSLMRATVHVALGWVLFVYSAAFGVAARHDVADARLVALAREFPATGRVSPDGGGTLIAPRWVLTAAHVAQQARVDALRVSFGGRVYAVKRIVVHPEGTAAGDRPPVVDLALLELVEPVEGVAPVPLYRNSDELGKKAFIVGFGDLGKGSGPPRRSDGQCRAVTNVIDGANSRWLTVRFDKPPEGTDLEGVGAPGDSGWPMYVQVDGTSYLAGVSHASTGAKPGRYGVTDIYMRVSAYKDWIDKAMHDGEP